MKFKSVVWLKAATEWLLAQPRRVKHGDYALLILWLHNNVNWAEGQYQNGLKLKPGQIWATYGYIANKLSPLDGHWNAKKVEKMIKRMEQAELVEVVNLNHSNKTIITLLIRQGETSTQDKGRPQGKIKGDFNTDYTYKSATVWGDQNTSEGETFTQDGGI